MYIKVLGGIFLLSSTTAMGFMKSEELKMRLSHLQELKRMTMLLQGELRFHRATLSEGFANVAERLETPFSCFLKELVQELENRKASDFLTLWKESANKLLLDSGLKKEDQVLIEQLGNSLGYLDITMQTENLNQVILQVEDAISRAKEQVMMKGKIYQTIGASMGALLTLLII